jgi:hypothetical protein
MLFIVSIMGLQGHQLVAASPDVEITDVQVPDQVAQAGSGQVQATVKNLVNTTFDGFARFADETREIRSQSPIDPLSEFVNFTIDPDETITVVVDYTVNETATVGIHTVTFEVNVGGFSFLFAQYPITVNPVATINSVVPGSVFSQGQLGLLLVTIENNADITRTVRIDVWGPKFVNASQAVDLAPGINNIVIPVMPNVSHVYDFGMFPANVSIFYFDEMISSQEVVIPVDMSLLNKILAVILPVGIFLALVLFYMYRKRQRVRVAAASE